MECVFKVGSSIVSGESLGMRDEYAWMSSLYIYGLADLWSRRTDRLGQRDDDKRLYQQDHLEQNKG